jgi:hypothetical protein
MIKRVQTFMLLADEGAFSEAILQEDPSATFVDGQRWTAPAPPVKSSIAECTDRWVYIWSKAVAASLPFIERADGGYDGPTAGPVIQFERSIMSGNELRSGRLAATIERGSPMAEFVRTCWRSLTHVTSDRIVTMAGERLPYRVGIHAMAWHLENPSNRLRDRSVEVFFTIDTETPAPRRSARVRSSGRS